ncbi:hypothetical protein [Terriglobus tenax]|uniref:hypothetical protein n=1 Tax=Terriglobus tenax TaxID=1111115 RepID=UPI0021E0A382|nr:hypothetical protein [Terriglobus tenax]
MKQPTLRAQRLRFTLALAATCTAILICLHQRHFVLSPGHPSTWLVMLQHKCGILFLLCSSWLAMEMIRIVSTFRSRTFPAAGL